MQSHRTTILLYASILFVEACLCLGLGALGRYTGVATVRTEEGRPRIEDGVPVAICPINDYPDDPRSSDKPSITTVPESVADQVTRLAVKKNKTALLKSYLFNKEYHDLEKRVEKYIASLPPEDPEEADPNPPEEPSDPVLARLLKRQHAIFDLRSDLEYHEKLEYPETPDIAILRRGLNVSMEKVLGGFGEPYTGVEMRDLSPDILKDHPVLVIPSQGFFGLGGSSILKAIIQEYVRNGGVLVTFAPQQGHELSLLPVPPEKDGSLKSVKGYGWAEDQPCYSGAVYIDTPHQMVSNLDKGNSTLSVAGFFTNVPSEATVLLRRSVNGRSVMITYRYGMGRVIATSIHLDAATVSSQTSSRDRALVRDIISWAKKPVQLPEAKPGGTVNTTLSITNLMDAKATAVKLIMYNPDRSAVLSEQTVRAPVPSGASIRVPALFTIPATARTGICHIDYVLLDPKGNVVQPHSETDSGRFAVHSFAGKPDKSLTLSPKDSACGRHAKISDICAKTDDPGKGQGPCVQQTVLDVERGTIDKSGYAANDNIKLSLKIHSKFNMSAMLKIWINEPAGGSVHASSRRLELTRGGPPWITCSCPLKTKTSGMHSLFYRIYSIDNRSLASGLVGFDVGNATLLNISTDKADYPKGTEPVNVRATFYGKGAANLSLDPRIRGETAETRQVVANGLTTIIVPLKNVQPGSVILRGILTAGGLESVKGTEFLYGSSLPDLAVNFGTPHELVAKDAATTVTVEVHNSGKSPSKTTNAVLYDGGTVIANKRVGPIAPGHATTFDVPWNVLGKAGKHAMKATVNSDRAMLVYNPENTTKLHDITIPDVALLTETDRTRHKEQITLKIKAVMMNLASATPHPDLTHTTTITNGSGTEVFRVVSPVNLPPSKIITLNQTWPTVRQPSPGGHHVTQILSAGNAVLARTRTYVSVW